MKFKINLDRYYPSEIIELHKGGLITLQEIIDSKVGYDHFDSLTQYIKQTKLDNLTKTKVTPCE